MKSSTSYKYENRNIIRLDRYSFAINNKISSYNNLKELLMNTLTKLHIKQFIDLTELIYINLKYNRLKEMGSDIFNSNTKLTTIDISYQIDSVNVVLDDLHLLRTLRMEHNKVNTLEEHIFKENIYGIESNRNTLNIEHIKLDCGCSMHWILEINQKGYRIKAKLSRVGMCKGPLNPKVSFVCFYENENGPMPCGKINRIYCNIG